MLSALLRAFFTLLHPKMLLLMVWPMAVAVLVWLGLAIAFWGQALQWVDLQLRSTDTVQWFLSVWPLALLATHLAWVVLAIAMVPLILVTAVILVGLFAMPTMVAHVAARDYPTLARRGDTGLAASLWNTLVATLAFLLLAVVTLPLWLVPLFWPMLPVLLFAYLNQRVFRHDALAEHASAAEMQQIFGAHRADLFLMGVVVGIAGHIPVLGFFVPVYAGLAFIHYGLARLQALRDAPVSSVGRIIEG